MAGSSGARSWSNLLFLRRSFAYRYAAAEMLRQARAFPPGPERTAATQVARALKDLARDEAWLEGQVPNLRDVAGRAMKA